MFLRHYEKRKIGKYLTTGNYGSNKYAIMACYHNMESYKQMHVYIQLEIARWQLAWSPTIVSKAADDDADLQDTHEFIQIISLLWNKLECFQ